MLLVKNYLAPSQIHGIGVYAAEDIPEGALIWRYEKHFDRRFKPDEFLRLSEAIREYYLTYGYLSTADGKYYFPFDNDKFMNHSFRPNIRFDADGNFYAKVAIAKDEEMTCDYREFDQEWLRYAQGYPVDK
ncbi:MAG: SET domain-containing protein [Alphaproteobacteria bacterium]